MAAGWHQRVAQARTIWVLEQSGEWACGMCCAGMALNWAGSGFPPESLMAAESRRTSGRAHRYEFALGDRPDMKASPLVGHVAIAPMHSIGNPGTTAQGVVDLLNGYPGMNPVVTHSPGATECKDRCRETTDDGKHPVILGLYDPPHFVICHSHIRRHGQSTIHLIADPGHGDVIEGHIGQTGDWAYLETSNGRYLSIIDEMIAIG